MTNTCFVLLHLQSINGLIKSPLNGIGKESCGGIEAQEENSGRQRVGTHACPIKGR